MPQEHETGDGSAKQEDKHARDHKIMTLAASQKSGISDTDLQVAVIVGSGGTTRYALLRCRVRKGGTRTVQGSLPYSE
ncbi:hypothetical protein GCM10025778_22090 [Paeniglutamicibacter antarcticus]|uniref:Uncharacterized protein n=1 Tax=Paeniglutamicibacter antarcticus TaxID=494023 RepID=A0ABP9TM01_9MICC